MKTNIKFTKSGWDIHCQLSRIFTLIIKRELRNKSGYIYYSKWKFLSIVNQNLLGLYRKLG